MLSRDRHDDSESWMTSGQWGSHEQRTRTGRAGQGGMRPIEAARAKPMTSLMRGGAVGMSHPSKYKVSGVRTAGTVLNALQNYKMDTNWCTICGHHIDFSDSDLYCSQACRKQDECPFAAPASLSPPQAWSSPLSSAASSPSLLGASPFHLGTCKISPPSFSLGNSNFDYRARP